MITIWICKIRVRRCNRNPAKSSWAASWLESASLLSLSKERRREICIGQLILAACRWAQANWPAGEIWCQARWMCLQEISIRYLSNRVLQINLRKSKNSLFQLNWWHILWKSMFYQCLNQMERNWWNKKAPARISWWVSKVLLEGILT